MKSAYSMMIVPFVLVVGCSSGDDQAGPEKARGEHAWKEQTRALEKAEEVDRMIQSAAEQQRRTIEEQSN